MTFYWSKNKILIAFVLFLFVLSLNFFRGQIKGFFYSFSLPIQEVFLSANSNITNFFKNPCPNKKLQEENEKLILQNQELFSEVGQLKEFQKENEVLRDALGLNLQKNFKLEMANIISKDPNQNIVLINKGKKAGISPNMPVLTQGKSLLGRVIESYNDFSRVLLISDKTSSFDAKIQDSNALGVIKGQGNSLIFELIPQEEEIKEGQFIVTSSLGGIFPKGLLVGSIIEINRSDVKPYQKATIKPFFDTTKTETVFIITEF